MPPKGDPKKQLTGGEKDAVVTNGSKDGSVKSGQVAAKHTDAQNVTNPKDLFAPAEGGAKTGHGTPPTKEAAASAPTAEGPEDTEMEDATVKDKEDANRIAELESQLRNEQGANMKMRRAIADYEKELASGSGGATKSLVERAQEIGFFQDVSGKLFLGPPPASRGFDYSKPYTYTNSKEIGGSLKDYEVGCGSHKRYKLDVMPVSQPPKSTFFSAATPLELARGAAVAEAENLTALQKELFYMGTSSEVVEMHLADPSEEQIVTAMLKMIDTCPERKQAFVEDSRVPLKCETTANPVKASRKIRVAERVRAALDGMTLQSIETIVVGGINASRFADALGIRAQSASTSVELRNFLMSHFAATVKRVFIWMDQPDNKVVAEVFIDNVATEVKAAAAWTHIMFVVMPPPYNDLRLSEFEAFMRNFNEPSPKLSNVLWLDESVCWNGYRFSHSLGSNELVSDHSSVYKDGTISSKGAAAAIMFLNKLCGWLIIEKHVADDHRQDHSNEESLHGVRQGGVTKSSSRGAPSRGGGGGLPQRGRGFQNNFGRGRGNQPNFGRGRGNQSNFGRRQGFY